MGDSFTSVTIVRTRADPSSSRVTRWEMSRRVKTAAWLSTTVSQVTAISCCAGGSGEPPAPSRSRMRRSSRPRRDHDEVALGHVAGERDREALGGGAPRQVGLHHRGRDLGATGLGRGEVATLEDLSLEHLRRLVAVHGERAVAHLDRAGRPDGVGEPHGIGEHHPVELAQARRRARRPAGSRRPTGRRSSRWPARTPALAEVKGESRVDHTVARREHADQVDLAAGALRASQRLDREQVPALGPGAQEPRQQLHEVAGVERDLRSAAQRVHRVLVPVGDRPEQASGVGRLELRGGRAELGRHLVERRRGPLDRREVDGPDRLRRRDPQVVPPEDAGGLDHREPGVGRAARGERDRLDGPEVVADPRQPAREPDRPGARTPPVPTPPPRRRARSGGSPPRGPRSRPRPRPRSGRCGRSTRRGTSTAREEPVDREQERPASRAPASTAEHDPAHRRSPAVAARGAGARRRRVGASSRSTDEAALNACAPGSGWEAWPPAHPSAWVVRRPDIGRSVG